MARQVKAAAIYARISSDHDGTALGVKRQLKDCRAKAEELGWPVAEEYVDNDVSAFSGKRRPAYERMMAGVADGTRDAVIVYHADRLHRRPIELEQFLAATDEANVRNVSFVSGPGVDVGNGDGLLILRIQGAVAANESATKGRRQRRKNDEKAAAGKPHFGSNRPFGYEEDRVTIRPAEAEIVRMLLARFLAGESLRSLTGWLQDSEVQTVRGMPWRTPTVKGLLTSERNAGLRKHRGEVIGPADWEPIFSETDRQKVLARFEQKRNTSRRTARRYVLSGALRCGKCDAVLYSQVRETTRRYVCLRGPDHGGCGQLTIVAAPLEELVTAAVLYRLDTPELARAFKGRAAETNTPHSSPTRSQRIGRNSTNSRSCGRPRISPFGNGRRHAHRSKSASTTTTNGSHA